MLGGDAMPMTKSRENKTVRRSVVLPVDLLKKVTAHLPLEYKNNFNGMIKVTLQYFLAGQSQEDFKRSIQEMSRDPSIIKECQSISKEFAIADSDGL